MVITFAIFCHNPFLLIPNLPFRKSVPDAQILKYKVSEIYFVFLLMREQLMATNKPSKIHGNDALKKSRIIFHSSFKIPIFHHAASGVKYNRTQFCCQEQLVPVKAQKSCLKNAHAQSECNSLGHSSV